nr:MAG TPA: AAA domain protein [Bacteriophage sp.]
MGREAELADESLSDYAINFLPVPRYSNAVLIEGIAGSGKTSSVFRQTVAMLRKFNPELLKDVAVVHGANSDSAVKIQEDIGLDDKNSKTYGRTEFMKEISSEWKEYPIDPVSGDQLVSKSDYQVTSENEIKSSLGIKESSSHPSLIILDEVSKFSSYDFDLIDKFAKKYGITVLTAGDFD